MSAVIDDWVIDGSREVHAVLNYTRNTGVRPVNYTFDPPPGAAASAHRRRMAIVSASGQSLSTFFSR